MKPNSPEPRRHVIVTFVVFLLALAFFGGLALAHTLLRSATVDWSNWIMAAATVGLFVFAYFSSRVSHEMQELQRQFVWLVGAVESQSDLSIKLQAKQQGIPVIWWDPTVQEWPKKPKHGDLRRVEVILNYLPKELRSHPENKPIDVDALLRDLKSKGTRPNSRVRKRKR